MAAGYLFAALAVYVKSIVVLFIGYAVLAGLGNAILYICPISTLQKWFPDHRGLAGGVAAYIFRIPPSDYTVHGITSDRTTVARVESDSIVMIETDKEFVEPSFANGDFVATSRLSNMAQDIFNKDAHTASIFVSIDGIFNMCGRLGFATVSDLLGRRNALFITFSTQALIIAILPTITIGQYYSAFMALIWIQTLCYGGAYGIIPALITDLFGSKNIAAVHGVMMTSIGISNPPSDYKVTGNDREWNVLATSDSSGVETSNKDPDILSPSSIQTLTEPSFDNGNFGNSLWTREFMLIYIIYFCSSLYLVSTTSRLANMAQDIFLKDAETVSKFLSILALSIAFSAQFTIMMLLPYITVARDYQSFVALVWVKTMFTGGTYGSLPALLTDLFGTRNMATIQGVPFLEQGQKR
eukprot:gene216-264_t